MGAGHGEGLTKAASGEEQMSDDMHGQRTAKIVWIASTTTNTRETFGSALMSQWTMSRMPSLCSIS